MEESNQWGNVVVKEIQEKWKNNRAVSLVFLKTDGGGPKAALEFAKQKGVDPKVWAVGCDDGAVYYQRINGPVGVWDCAILDGAGKLVRLGSSGSKWSDGPDAGKYVVSTLNLAEECGAIKAILSKEYPPELADISQRIESGDLGAAAKACMALEKKGKPSADLVALRGELDKALEAYFKGRTEQLMDAGLPWPHRYSALRRMELLLKDAGKTLPAAVEAAKAISKFGMTKEVKAERDAEKVYGTALEKWTNAKENKARDQAIGDLLKVAKRNRDTLFGDLAAMISLDKKVEMVK